MRVAGPVSERPESNREGYARWMCLCDIVHDDDCAYVVGGGTDDTFGEDDEHDDRGEGRAHGGLSTRCAST